ncbi:MAG TPA: glycoside hydrolase family 9 protein [Desulfuromonadaceae bacterium]|nr:glycoside hydrolase family 9 protein [Desulfuromonadaceae bacterium]
MPSQWSCIAVAAVVPVLYGFAAPEIYVNQVAYEKAGPKTAVVRVDEPLSSPEFVLVDAVSSRPVLTNTLGRPTKIEDWSPGKIFYQADFSTFAGEGHYRLRLRLAGTNAVMSDEFAVGTDALARTAIGAIVGYYHKQRADTAEELAADRNMRVHGSDRRVDVHGGWCDASGDVSKYFSHLAYANVMSPQQTPLVVWSMAGAVEGIPEKLEKWGLAEPLRDEALYGADYLTRCLSTNDYFYMVVFSYFKKDPNAREIVGLRANSVTTDEYQCAFREGGGLAIAALARVSRWNRHGEFTSQQYLEAAKRAFAHLQANNTRYDDDGRENIIDDYCALLAATELWIATDDPAYQAEARKRAAKLASRMTSQGFFRTDEAGRPFWHASDAGLPVVALSRFLTKEGDTPLGAQVRGVIRFNLDYQLRVTGAVDNPFGYARQTFLYQGILKEGFFIPHDNETGWWWQGENARLASLATAALVGGRIVEPASEAWGVKEPLAQFASRQISWILGSNPYSMCFLYGFGQRNVPHMHSNYGHGSEKGGISNGITGADGRGDGSGIDFKLKANGNEWRWTEQWLPHAAWFLQAMTAMAQEDGAKN